MQNKENFLSETMIFPPIAFFTAIAVKNILVIDAFENYQKKSLRNRFILDSSQGSIELSLPLKKGKHQNQLITAVELSYAEQWQIKHWRTIQSIYGKSPYFIYYKEELKELFYQQEKYLFDFNKNILKYLLDAIRLDIFMIDSSEFIPTKDPIPELSGKIPYYQCYRQNGVFISGLSILDLLFHCGPESILYLNQFYQNKVFS